MTEPHLIGNRYELGALIGYGGMAEVHMGRDVRLGRQVALKILRTDLARDPSFQTRFRREAQSAGGLNHPSIVSVYDTGEDHRPDGIVPYIVMEYVDGRTLREVLSNETRLEPVRAMEITSEICAALDFSHRNGIVHRDVKPANVMITKSGAVKVMDFGIARAVADNASTVTQTAAVIGTAQYLSPEQARGESVDARSDVYSTGCLLYELITGTPPFQGDSPVAVAYQHVRESAPVPSTIFPGVPRSLDSIVMKALAKNPLNRYQTAADMRADLQRAIAEQPVNAEPVLSDEERTQLIARTPAGGAAAAAAAARRVVQSGPIRMKDDPEPPVDGNGRRSALIWAAVVVVLLLVIGGTAYALLSSNDKPQAKTEMVVVPDLVGKTQAAAITAITDAKLSAAAPLQVRECSITTIPKGSVCTQDPDAGASVAVNSKITISVYVGPETVNVPSIVGLTQAEAIAKLNLAKLSPQPSTVHNSQPPGQVVTQTPVANTPVALNAIVKFTVADGKVQIPDLPNQNSISARATLNVAGLTSVAPNDILVTTPNRSLDGLVQRSDPAKGSWVPPTATVTLYVYKYVPAAPTCTTASPTPTPTAKSTSPSPTTSPTPTDTTTTGSTLPACKTS